MPRSVATQNGGSQTRSLPGKKLKSRDLNGAGPILPIRSPLLRKCYSDAGQAPRHSNHAKRDAPLAKERSSNPAGDRRTADQRQGKGSTDAMCHPIVSDLSRGRNDRILSGLRLRRGMRPGGDVFHLHGRVPGSGAGRRAAGSAGTASAGTIPPPFRGERLIFALSSASKQQDQRLWVGSQECVCAVQPEDYSTKLVPFSERFVASFRHPGERREDGNSVSEGRCPKPKEFASNLVCALRQVSVATPVTEAFVRPGAAIDEFRGKQWNRPARFCRTAQRTAAVGQIATGASRTNTKKSRSRASVIVSVTTLGNVTASLQLIPRG